MLKRTAVLRALAEGTDELGQALAMLGASGVEQPHRLTLAEGDRVLLDVHRQATGRDVELTVTCPACGTVNETSLAAGAMPASWPRMAPLGRGGGLRAPTYADLLDLVRARGEGAQHGGPLE